MSSAFRSAEAPPAVLPATTAAAAAAAPEVFLAPPPFPLAAGAVGATTVTRFFEGAPTSEADADALRGVGDREDFAVDGFADAAAAAAGRSGGSGEASLMVPLLLKAESSSSPAVAFAAVVFRSAGRGRVWAAAAGEGEGEAAAAPPLAAFLAPAGVAAVLGASPTLRRCEGVAAAVEAAGTGDFRDESAPEGCGAGAEVALAAAVPPAPPPPRAGASILFFFGSK